jgi:hypothetical protein
MIKAIACTVGGILLLATSVASAQDGRGRTAAGDYKRSPPVARPMPPPQIARRPPPPVFAPLPRVQVWTPSFPYQARYHDTCQRKAWRLRWFERRAAADGYYSPGERAEMSALRRDLRRTCGDWRWRD